MFLINWTGLSKIYWLPRLSWKKEGNLWYVEVKILFLQIAIYSLSMANHIIERTKR
jgi:hypothetical protein